MSDPLLTAAELADQLGFSAGTIMDWAEADKIPAFKVGKAWRFRRSEIDEWLEQRRRGPRPSSAPAAMIATTHARQATG